MIECSIIRENIVYDNSFSQMVVQIVSDLRYKKNENMIDTLKKIFGARFEQIYYEKYKKISKTYVLGLKIVSFS